MWCDVMYAKHVIDCDVIYYDVCNACMYVCMYVCIYASMYLCMCVCMCNVCMGGYAM